MEKTMTAKTSHRFLSFMIDMLLIGLVMQLFMMIFKGPFENWLHLEQLENDYFNLGIAQGVFDSNRVQISGLTSAQIEAFLEASKPITDELNKNNMIANAICALLSSSIFQFIIPAILGEGRTIGKVLTKLRVVKKDGSKINFLTIFLRGFVGMTLIEFVISMPLGFLPFTVSAVLVFASNSKRALHDYIAGTIVTFAEGFEPKVREKNINEYDHKRVKGFEYIDIEALEKREQEAQQRMEKAKEEGKVNDQPEVVEPKKDSKSVNDISLDDIEKREQEALERMKNKKENSDSNDANDVIDNEEK